MVDNNGKIDVSALLYDFLRVVRKMWLRFVILIVIGALVSGLMANFNYSEKYTAYTSFTVNIWDEEDDSGFSAYYDNEAAEQMADTFPYILTSGVLQRKVAKDMGTAGVSGSIDASVIENTNLFTLSVTDSDPKRAYETLQAVIENYPSVSEAVVGKLNMNILDESGIPEYPDNPKDLKKDAVKGGVVGFAIALAWAIFVTLTRRTIKSEEDCQKYVNQRCLGTVPFVKIKERSDKTKRHLNIMKRTINGDFKEAIRIIRNKVERHTHNGEMKKIVVTSALAGEGKSTIAVNLAISLAQEGKRVTLVDCDLRNPSDNEIMGIEPELGLIDYLNGDIDFKQIILPFNHMIDGQESLKLYFIPGGKAVADGSNLLGSDKMKELIDVISNVSDYVILDSPPVGLLTDASVLGQFADCAMFIVKKDFAKAQHIMNGIEHLAESSIPVVGCVLNGE